MYEDIEMRKILCDEIDSLMEHDERIAVLDADLAKADGTIRLRDKYPDRAFDIGIAEQNMASVAAGMAAYGMIPFIGSFTPFATRRICDQLAISVTYAGRSVKIIGSDPGISAELNGGTHMSVEDIGVLRSIPGMVIFEPVDGVQLRQSVKQIVDYDGPVYIRLFRKAAPYAVFGSGYKFDLFKADNVREGKDVTVFASGIMVGRALEAATELACEGVSAEVINIHTIKPIDREAVVASARKTGAVVTCENHNVIGGLRSAVAEVLTEEYPVYITPVGIRDHFGEVGKMPFLSEKYGMTSADITAAAREAVRKKH
jgi:transketolase